MSSFQNNIGDRFDLNIEDIEYRHDGERSWLARVYQPKKQGLFPALLDIHGGAWNHFDRMRNAPLMEKLASRGAVIASIDYRDGQKNTYPSSLIDINFAARWLKENASKFNATEKVGLVGISSGGHLALLSAVRPHDKRFSALKGFNKDATVSYVISFSGVLIPFARYMHAKANKNTELIEDHDRYFNAHEDMHDANPVRDRRQDENFVFPPALLIQGTADALLPHGMVENVAARYRAAGGEAEIAWFEHMPHGIFDWPDDEVERLADLMMSFIRKNFGSDKR